VICPERPNFPRRISIEIAFEADFADIFEVRGTSRKRRGDYNSPETNISPMFCCKFGPDAF